MTKSVDDVIAESKKVPEATLANIRKKLAATRDLALSISDKKQSLKDDNAKLFKIKHEELPSMFTSAGIDHLGLVPDNNLPGFDFDLKPYYRANIAAEWSAEKRAKAFKLLEKAGGGDLIKTTFIVYVPRDEKKKATMVRKSLMKLKVSFIEELAVPWQTLSAFIKEQMTGRRKVVFPTETLEAWGATVGMVVEGKEKKPDV